MRKKHLSAGDVLINEGSECPEMYIIRSGRFRVYKMINGERIELATLKEKAFAGEISTLLGTPASASVAAMEDAEVDALDLEELKASIQKRPETALKMMSVLAARLKRANDHISELTGEKTSLEIIYGLKE